MSSLDLAEPVVLIIDHFKKNWSLKPVVVGSGSDTRGGFDPGDGLKYPRIIPVEGKPGELRKGRTKLATILGKTEITVYKVGTVPTESGYNKRFAHKETHLTIDIYNGEGKIRLDGCYKEVERLCYLLNGSIGGNYTRLRVGDDTDLTNRAAGLWRTTLEIYLLKVSDYIGA